jgi:hypothetical protein
MKDEKDKNLYIERSVSPEISRNSNKSLYSDKNLSINQSKNIIVSNYFGTDARLDFYSNFQKMQKQRLKYTGNERTIERYNQMKSKSSDRIRKEDQDDNSILKPPNSFYSSNSPVSFHGPNVSGNRNAIRNNQRSTSLFSKPVNNHGNSIDMSDVINHNKLRKSIQENDDQHDLFPLLIQGVSRESDRDEQLFSPRTKYLGACIRENMPPLAKLVLRKTLTNRVNLANFGIRDKGHISIYIIKKNIIINKNILVFII